MFDTFGNKVKIKRSAETKEKGLAGKIGEVYGETTPSLMNFKIIGQPKQDYAVNVYFEDLGKSFWFDADLLEHLDSGQGTVITLDDIGKKWTKGENGEWIEEDILPSQKEAKVPNTKSETHKKWWEFWKK